MRKNAEKGIECFSRACGDRPDCLQDVAMAQACAAEHPVRIIAYRSAPTNTTRSQVRALEIAFPDALRVERMASCRRSSAESRRSSAFSSTRSA